MGLDINWRSTVRIGASGLLAAGVILAGGSVSAAPARLVPAAATYPRDMTSIPQKFRGRWDEETDDGCAERESRFGLFARTLTEFEVTWKVKKVRLHGPNEIELFVTTEDEDGKPISGTWGFILLPDGSGLTDRPAGEYTYRRCRVD